MGKLEGDELRYAKTLAGSWSKCYNYSGFADDYKITSMRDVLQGLQEHASGLTRTCRIQNVNTVFFWFIILRSNPTRLATEAVQRAALALESIDNVHGGDGLASCVLCVRHSVADDVVQEHLQNASRFFVDQSGDAFDASSTSQTSDGRLGDALDIVAQDFFVSLCAAFAQPFSSFASSRHLLSSSEVEFAYFFLV